MVNVIVSTWDDPDIKETGTYYHHSSTQFYDNIEDPTLTPRDRKNMRVDSTVKHSNNTGGGSNPGGVCQVEIDPDKTNILEKREKGLYVPPVMWEK